MTGRLFRLTECLRGILNDENNQFFNTRTRQATQRQRSMRMTVLNFCMPKVTGTLRCLDSLMMSLMV